MICPFDKYQFKSIHEISIFKLHANKVLQDHKPEQNRLEHVSLGGGIK